MTTRFSIVVFSLLVTLTIGCATTATSTLTGETYDASEDKTTLILVPQGNVVLPGKWTKISYNESSRQHFFKSEDNVEVAIAKGRPERFSFFQPNQSEADFIKRFFEWDSEYWSSKGLTTQIIYDNTDNGYILWEAFDGKDVHTTLLFGLKHGMVYNLSVTSSAWDEEQIQDFLVTLYVKN